MIPYRLDPFPTAKPIPGVTDNYSKNRFRDQADMPVHGNLGS
jgi:hypothetical protein